MYSYVEHNEPTDVSFGSKFHTMLDLLDNQLDYNFTHTTSKFSNERWMYFGENTSNEYLRDNIPRDMDHQFFKRGFNSGRYGKLNISFIVSYVRKWIQSTMKLDLNVIHCGKIDNIHTICIVDINSNLNID